jgi:excinuclease UvrABC ATPase subunit
VARAAASSGAYLTIQAARGGHGGGRIGFEGTPADLLAARSTLAGERLAAYVGT